jgi:uncharacterized membrane protein
MGRKVPVKNRQPAPQRATPVQWHPNWWILALSLIGIALTAYISWADSSGSGLKGCAVDSACDVVLSSRWATLLGVPTAAWGLLAYLTLAVTALLRRPDRQWYIAWTVSFFGVVYSVYLTTVSMTLLGATCPYCLTSLGIMASIFVVATAQRPAALPGFSWRRWLPRVSAAAAVAIAALHLNYVGILGQPPATEEPMVKALAMHLTQRGVKMYGASWCPHCVDQKEIFGASARRIPYVECSTGGPRSAMSSACQAARITSYPTWIIDGKRIQEVLTLQQLADMTGFRGKDAAQPAAPGG